MNKNKKRWIGVLLVLLSVVIHPIEAAIKEDEGIVSATIENQYLGRVASDDIKTAVSYTDVGANYWGKEAITRMSVLGVSTGYVSGNSKQFRPNNQVSKQEALAFILRALGYEQEAKRAAENIGQLPGEGLIDIWSKGYMTVARNIGLIDAAMLADGLSEELEGMDPTVNFIRTAPASRQEVAKWVAQTVHAKDETMLNPRYQNKHIYAFNDWESIGLTYAPYVEAIVEAKIMNGDGKNFSPQKGITRAEMMQLLKNLNDLLYHNIGLVSKDGVIGHIEGSLELNPAQSSSKAVYLIRTASGKVDSLTGEVVRDNINRVIRKDVIVYKNNRITNLSALAEGDSVQYIVDNTGKEVYYVLVTSPERSYHISGRLQPLDNIDKLQISILVDQTKRSYTIADNLYHKANQQIAIDGRYIKLSNAPVSYVVSLSVNNNIVTEINYDIAPTATGEVSGIVAEHNTDFNYLRIIDWEGNQTVKKYNQSTIVVEKQNYYSPEDKVGYLDELYPYYGLDPLDSSIDEIEVGDIVHAKIDGNDAGQITSIRAKTNYIVKYGQIMNKQNKGDAGYVITVQMDNNSYATYPVTNQVVAKKGNANIPLGKVEIGDMVRLLINQGVVEPGTVKETVKQITVDPYGNLIETIYKGKLGNVNTAQQTLDLLNSYELIKTGWANYKARTSLDISKRDFECYYNQKLISLDYATTYLNSDEIEMYVATEKYYSNQKVTKILFCSGRDSVLDFSNINSSNGVSALTTGNAGGSIRIDPGTIAVKNNRLISLSNIMPPDYAQIVLNGNNQAAVIRVEQQPRNDSISIFRGRVSKINDLKDFTVQSHAVLSDMRWTYTPIERSFIIDYKTVIKDGDKIMNINDFIGYSESSKVDQVYNIVADGTKALYIVKGAYARDGVKGSIVSIDKTDQKITLKDSFTYDKNSKQWNFLSNTNSQSVMNLENTSLIVKNNQVITINELKQGDKIRVMTTVDLAAELKLNNKRTFIGTIVFVED